MTVERQLAAYVHDTSYDQITSTAIETARRSTLDILGVTLAGQKRPEIRLLQRVTTRWGGAPDSPVLGAALRLPPPAAALLNGAAARVLDFDDVVDPLGIHPSVAIFPTLVAIAASRAGEVDGRDFLAATAIGQDLCTRLARARKETLLESGRYDLSKVIAAAAAGAKLYGLDEQGILAAMGVAYTSALGETQCMVEGAPTVSYQQGLVASNAVRAVMLSAEGFYGAQRFLTGRYGLFSAFEPGSRIDDVLHDLGRSFAGDQDIAYKLYPTCRPNISAARLAMELAGGRKLRPDDVETIEIRMNQQIFDLVCEPAEKKWRPETPVEARFSMAYTVAVALIGGDILVADYDEAALGRSDVLALGRKVRPLVDPACDIAELGTHGRIAIAILFADGHRRTGAVDKPKGHPSDPLTDEELREKFRKCVAAAYGIAGLERANSLISVVETFDRDQAGLGRLLDEAS